MGRSRIPIARTRALNALPNALSLSRMRYLGAQSHGNASVIWRASHSATQMQSARCALLEDIELMPQHQDFGFQPSTRLETVAQHSDEEKSHCDHQPQSCSDSAAAVTPADGVFGSDRGILDKVINKRPEDPA